MNDRVRAMAQGAFFGAAAAAGACVLVLWWILLSSPNAGAMVDGAFRPYGRDDSIHAFALGGAVLLGLGIGGLAWSGKRLSR